MPKSVRPAPGEVVEQVTQTRVIPATAEIVEEDDSNIKPSDGKPRDAFDYMASLSPVEVDAHLVYVYREYPPGESGYIDCMKPPIDEAYIKKEFGGGTYNVLVKKGSEIKRGKKLKIVGTPLSPGAHSNGGGSSSDLVQTVRMILKKNAAAIHPAKYRWWHSRTRSSCSAPPRRHRCR